MTCGILIETRSLPTLTRSYPRCFALYVASPKAPFVLRFLPIDASIASDRLRLCRGRVGAVGDWAYHVRKESGRFSEQNFTSAFCTFSTSSLGRFNALTIQPFKRPRSDALAVGFS
jgi:hypothetical protein